MQTDYQVTAGMGMNELTGQPSGGGSGYSYSPPGEQAPSDHYNFSDAGGQWNTYGPGTMAPVNEAQFSHPTQPQPPSDSQQIQALQGYNGAQINSALGTTAPAGTLGAPSPANTVAPEPAAPSSAPAYKSTLDDIRQAASVNPESPVPFNIGDPELLQWLATNDQGVWGDWARGFSNQSATPEIDENTGIARSDWDALAPAVQSQLLGAYLQNGGEMADLPAWMGGAASTFSLLGLTPAQWGTLSPAAKKLIQDGWEASGGNRDDVTAGIARQLPSGQRPGHIGTTFNRVRGF